MGLQYVKHVDQVRRALAKEQRMALQGAACRHVPTPSRVWLGIRSLSRCFARPSTPGERWCNYHPLGGDPSLDNLYDWARKMLRRGMVRPSDAEAWCTAFVNVEGGGNGHLVVPAVDKA